MTSLTHLSGQRGPDGSSDGATRRTVERAPMAPEALATHVRERLEHRVVDHLIAYGQLTITVEPSAVPMAAHLCRDDPRLDFDFFDFMSGVDEREDGFAVVTHLYSTRHRHHIQIRALAEGGRESPRLPTISHLYRGANWHERETYDMFGVEFEGHPGLLPRILTVENFEGFPLRKEFLLMTREVKPWPGLKEPKEVEEDEDGDGGAETSPGPSAEEKARMAREKAERAKAKAAEARKRRARERAERSEAAGGGSSERAERSEAAGGDTAEKDAAVAAGAGDDDAAGDPQEAAAIADSAVAKDAAAGAVGGDTAAGAPSDVADADQPVEDRAAEREVAEGGAATPSGTPGIESEGRHAGAEAQAGDRPARETPGMTSDTQDAEAAPPRDQTPEPDEITKAFQDTEGGRGLPPVGPGEEEPRALADGGVQSVPLADEHTGTVGETVADRPEPDRPVGTDADDRLRDLDEDQQS